MPTGGATSFGGREWSERKRASAPRSATVTGLAAYLRERLRRAKQPDRHHRPRRPPSTPRTREALESRGRALASGNQWTAELDAIAGVLIGHDAAHVEAWQWRGRCAACRGDGATMRTAFRQALRLVAGPVESRNVLDAYVVARRDHVSAARRSVAAKNLSVITAFEARHRHRFGPTRGSAAWRIEREQEYQRALERWDARTNPGRSCKRCGGVGYIPRFSHVENGICFLCRGRG